MKRPTMENRENSWKDHNYFRDEKGQAHFPPMTLGSIEVDPVNPWALKRIPKKMIVWKGA